MLPNICRDHGRAGCLTVADPVYTMFFDDIGEHPIYWCSWCGPQAQEITKLLNKAFDERPNFAEDFKAAIDKAMNNPTT